jgi:hypothetical protein
MAPTPVETLNVGVRFDAALGPVTVTTLLETVAE